MESSYYCIFVAGAVLAGPERWEILLESAKEAKDFSNALKRVTRWIRRVGSGIQEDSECGGDSLLQIHWGKKSMEM